MGQSNRTPNVPPKSPITALVLSFVWPGLGQAYLGRPRWAIVFATPVLLAFLALLWEARDGTDILIARILLVPSAALGLAVIAIGLAIWRLASMVAAVADSRAIARAPRPVAGGRLGGSRPAHGDRSRAWWTLAVLGVVVALVHGAIAWAGLAFAGTASHVYVAGGPDGTGPDDIGARPTPWATPLAGGRINVLLIGADSGLGYTHSLTDTMILVSVDPATRHVDMLSFPRDIGRFPLYSGGRYDDKLNSLAAYAAQHPAEFPSGGIATLAQEIGYLIGTPIHYYAFINLAGFKALIDAVGGIDIVNRRAISDPGYEFPDHQVGFFLSAGPHHLDGRTALAYVRSRNGPGDSDFTRAARQQELLVALRTALTNPAMLPNLPDILQAIGQVLQTDYPAEGVADLLQLAKQIPAANVSHYVLGPPYATRALNVTSTYMLVIDDKKFAALSIRLFGAESAFANAAPSASP